MAKTNVLIGIGGTGSKIVESALHLLAAGVGGDSIDEVIVGAVEQDGQNGNCGRMQILLTTLASLQALREDENANRLVANPAVEGFCRFLSIRLSHLFAAEGDEAPRADWCPEEKAGQTLNTILGVKNKDPDRQAFYSLLYGEEEQRMTLEGGYVGCAHVGAAAMRAAIGDSRFKTRLDEILGEAGKNRDVRIFLAGSAFGGTGAAGFPTLARHINTLRRRNKNGTQLEDGQVRCRTGGVLMLPYFAFEDAKDPQAAVVRSNETLRNSGVALEYYNGLGEENIFDRFYLAGWDSLFQLNYHSPKGDEQKNPPLPPELYGALAAIDFFSAPKPADEGYLACAREDPDRFGWADLPRGEEARDRLGRLLRMAAYWRLSMNHSLEQSPDAGMPPWRRAFAASSANWEDVPGQVNEYFEKLLVWAASLRLFSGTGNPLAFTAWDSSGLILEGAAERPEQAVTVQRTMASDDLDANYIRLVPSRQPADPPRSAVDLYSDINDRRVRKPVGDNKGLGQLLAELHHAARTETRTGGGK